ncbi:MAG: copper homeostasis protein CutC [Sphingobacteriaceae bacterium]
MKELEIACFNLPSAKIAARAGADRIEFCADYSLGGVTPSKADFSEFRAFYSGPIYVMIRPRGGNFVYTDTELSQMQKDIYAFGKLGADGFVFGALSADGCLDMAANTRLIAAAAKRPCTFHRAFDSCTNQQEALSQLESIGFNSILSSGGMKTALEGIENLRSLQKNTKLNIIAGGGIRSSNLLSIAKQFDTQFYHSSGILTGDIANNDEIHALKKALALC